MILVKNTMTNTYQFQLLIGLTYNRIKILTFVSVQCNPVFKILYPFSLLNRGSRHKLKNDDIETVADTII